MNRMQDNRWTLAKEYVIVSFWSTHYLSIECLTMGHNNSLHSFIKNKKKPKYVQRLNIPTKTIENTARYVFFINA